MAGEGEAYTAGVEVGAMGLMKLLARWIPAFSKIQFAGRLAIPAAGAGAIWLLAKPWGDDDIEKSWNAWRSASQNLQDMRFNDWDNKVKAIQAAWPEGADRQQFDKFIATVKNEFYQTDQALGAMSTAVQNAQTQIHQIMHTVGIVADLLLATIIACELAEAAFPPDAPIVEALKNATGAVLMGVTAVGVGSVVVALLYNLGNIAALASSETAFPQPQPNRGSGSLTKNTDFDDIKVQNTQHGGWTYY
ncbi:hypothetical protein AB0L00_10430 [Actinoallomurus sp. NPDC052308]|uniref:hypothetical protein n=1 Tax=Actinoallomurus sp. NPDC052308 TaxID=3155530 RepID=UPI00342E6C63